MGQTIDNPKVKISDMQLEDFTILNSTIAEAGGSIAPVAGRRFSFFLSGGRTTERVIFQDIIDQLQFLSNQEKDNLANLVSISNYVDYLTGFEQRSQEKCEKRMEEDCLYKILTLIARMFQKQTSGEALLALKTNIDLQLTTTV